MRPGFICTHVADQKLPVSFVHHSEPVEDGDSGWSLACAAGHESSEWLLVDLDRYIDQDPELQQLREVLAEGWMAHRAAPGQPWVQEPMPAEAEAA